jgi:ATP-binding cassette subfamily C protein LapB
MSLLDRAFLFLTGKTPRYDQPTQERQLLNPLTVKAALERLATHCGYSASAEMLTAALPVKEGFFDPRYVPIALGRIGIQTRDFGAALGDIGIEDLPLLAMAGGEGAVIVTGAPSRTTFTIIDGDGEREVLRSDLSVLGDVTLLACGHGDPQNGLDFEDERAFVRKNPRLWMLGVFMSERRRLVQMVMTAALLNLCGLALPLYMRAIYDKVVPNLAIESLWALSAGVVLALIFEFAFRQIRTSFVDAVGVRVAQVVQNRAMNSFMSARLGRKNPGVGSMMNALRDVDSIALFVPQLIVTFLIDIPFFLAFVALIALIGGYTAFAPVIGAACLLAVGMVASFAARLSATRCSKLMHARNNLVVDAAGGIETIKANMAEGHFLGRWDKVSDHIGVTAKSARKWNDLPQSMASLLVQLVTVLVVIISVFQIKAGVMTTGALIAVSMLTSRAMAPVTTAVSLLSKAQQARTQLAGLADLLELESEREIPDPGVRQQAIKGEFSFSSVSYKHEDSAAFALQDVSLTIKPGEKIALIGRSGSGKSTLLQVLAGMLEPRSGQYLLDGYSAAHYSVAQIRQQVVLCSQDAQLFDTSIWDNILLGLNEPSADIVTKAVRAANLDSFVERSVEGYNRKLGPGGKNLSGGQRKSILLARALVRDPAVLLLDEPTEAMDVGSEKTVMAGLQQATQDKTLIIATHRIALLDIVDRVIWLDNGKIIADAPKAEVIAKLQSRPMPRAA